VLAAVERLKQGEATPPMITGPNASIFYLEAKRGAKTTLYEKRFTDERRDLLDELRRKARLQVYDADFARLVPAEYKTALTTAQDNGTTASAGARRPATMATPAASPSPSPSPRRGLGALFGSPGRRTP
jgi:hypothetical protein